MVWDAFTIGQRETIKRMCAEGRTNREIAKAIGCPANSIRSCGWQYRAMLAKRPPLERVVIQKEDVISYYEIGWRFIGFKGDLCMFEWQSEREPKWPEQMREAA